MRKADEERRKLEEEQAMIIEKEEGYMDEEEEGGEVDGDDGDDGDDDEMDMDMDMGMETEVGIIPERRGGKSLTRLSDDEEDEWDIDGIQRDEEKETGKDKIEQAGEDVTNSNENPHMEGEGGRRRNDDNIFISRTCKS